MAVTGPIPKHSDQLVRRNKQEVPITKIEAIGVVPIPDLDMPDAHQLVKDLYQAMRQSAQSKYFEPSDWQMARLTMHAVNDMLKGRGEDRRISPMMLASVNSMLSSLLVTEGDRRRVRLEVERNQNEATVTDIASLFRQRMEQGR